VSERRIDRLLIRLYPPAWRARYGEELEALIVESSGERRTSWSTRADVALAAGRERLHSAGLAGEGVPPGERARAGELLVLCAWVLFVVAGAGVAKFSEHWQDATPRAARQVPAGAFDGLTVAAGIASLLVLLGIASAMPSLVRFLRAGGWPAIRRRVVTAAVLSGVAIAATVALAAWARHLNVQQRNGGNPSYSGIFIIWALLVVGSLAAWTRAAVAAARRLSLPPGVLRLDAWLAAAVTLAMAVMTAATAIWWAALANSAPWTLSGSGAGSPGSPLPPQLLAYATLMLIATLLGAFGAVLARRGLIATPG
jgi:hypothetical protein